MRNILASKIKITESVVVYLLTTLLFGLLFAYYKSMMPYSYGDTAFLIEVVSNLAKGLPPTSEILAQNWAVIKLGTAPLTVYCQHDLVAGMFTSDPYNWLSSLHAYIILYLIAPFAAKIGALKALSAFMALTFAIIPCVAYFFLRKSGVSVAVSILAAAICMIHPAWQISSGGQFYTDRFFIPFALLYVLHVHQYFKVDTNLVSESNRYLLLAFLFGVLGGLTSERNMVTIVIFSVGYSLFAQTSIKKRAVIIGFAMLCSVYTFSYLYFWGGSTDNGGVQAGLLHWQSFVYAAKIAGVGEYLLLNLVLLVLPALFAPRVFVAVLPIVAINCLVTMGGAEKNGWLTHYHSHYYGFLMGAFLIAIANTQDTYGERIDVAIHRLILPITAGIALTLLILVPHFYKGQSVSISLWDYFGRAEAASFTRGQKSQFDEIAKNVPIGATVTTSEWGMAAWYLRGNKVNYFPLGVGHSDFIMVQAEGAIPGIKILSAIRYGDDAVLANECIAPVISANYKEVSRVGGWALFKKL